MSAKNITVITLDGRKLGRTRKTASRLFERGNHAWRDDFTLIELKTDSSHPDYSRFLLPGQISRRILPRIPLRFSTYIPEKMPPPELPGVHFEEPRSARWREQHRLVTFAGQPA